MDTEAKPKSESVRVRVTESEKQTLSDAAQKRNETLSQFILEASMAAASEEPEQLAHHVHNGLPTFIKAFARTVALGGAYSYVNFGSLVAESTEAEIPDDTSIDEWTEELKEIESKIRADDGEGIWNWYKAKFPRIMRLVPAAKKDRFTEGVLRSYTNGKLWFI